MLSVRNSGGSSTGLSMTFSTIEIPPEGSSPSTGDEINAIKQNTNGHTWKCRVPLSFTCAAGYTPI